MDNFKDENGHNGAYLAANLFKDYFESLQRPAFIHEEVIRANNLLKSKMKHYQIDLSKKRPSLVYMRFRNPNNR
ncbi:hypothetical protein RWE15_03325 [Virgibacillus halophilus]|uniref:Uncharacterized protein n=1 Tax=Tigheibacillus halophilus TaxID=361280 RepID=A0ABU5C330_9BACI|nr:hypothetical protein [Virgibacillus halophilus]